MIERPRFDDSDLDDSLEPPSPTAKNEGIRKDSLENEEGFTSRPQTQPTEVVEISNEEKVDRVEGLYPDIPKDLNDGSVVPTPIQPSAPPLTDEDQTDEPCEEPECVKKDVYKVLPELEEVETEIKHFDSSTHDKSEVEEEYYKLKKKELEVLNRSLSEEHNDDQDVNQTESNDSNQSSSCAGSSESGQMADRSGELQSQGSSGERASLSEDNEPSKNKRLTRSAHESEDIHYEKLTDSDSNPSTATDHTVITTSRKSSAAMKSKSIQDANDPSMSIESDDVVLGKMGVRSGSISSQTSRPGTALRSRPGTSGSLSGSRPTTARTLSKPGTSSSRPGTSSLRRMKILNQTFSTDEDVITGRVNTAKLPDADQTEDTDEFGKTYVISKQESDESTDKQQEEKPEIPAKDQVEEHENIGTQDPTTSESIDNDTIEELRSLSSAPRQRRLVTSMSMNTASQASSTSPAEDLGPFYHASIRNRGYMDRLHGQSMDTTDTAYCSDRDVEDEDQFDDFYPGNIRQKMLASSFSVADSDAFDPHRPVNADDDSKIVTALEAITSTESESTASVDTKVTNKNKPRMEVKLSFGNTAITESMEEFVEFCETAPTPKNRKKVKHALTQDFDAGCRGKIVQIKLQEESSSDSLAGKSSESSHSEDNRAAFKDKKMSYYSLNVDKYDTAARRLLLHRENAIQGNSTPEDDLSARSNNGSTEVDLKASIAASSTGSPSPTAEDKEQPEIHEPELKDEKEDPVPAQSQKVNKIGLS